MEIQTQLVTADASQRRPSVTSRETGHADAMPSTPAQQRRVQVHFLPADFLTDACVRYRCDHLQEQLELRQEASSLTWLRTPEELVLSGDVLVLNRAGYSERVQQVIDAARSLGQAVVYGADDLMVSPDVARKGIIHHEIGEDHEGAEFKFCMQVWNSLRDISEAQSKTLSFCDCAIVSTEYLAARIRELGKPAYVVRNAMSQEMMHQSEAVHRDRSLTGGRVVLGYLSGTASHNHDFGDIAEVVAGLMHRYRQVYLTIVGPMRLPECLVEFGPRVRRLPFVPWQDLPDLIADTDINLAPLDMLQPFNHAKSEIKWMEAGAVGVPTVASATRGNCEAIRHGENGLLATTPGDWEHALEELITQADLRERLGEAARREVERHYTAEARSYETAAAFAEIAERYAHMPEGRAPAVIPPLAPSPASPHLVSLRRIAGRAKRGLLQTLRNGKRLLSPYYWSRVLSRWENG